MATLDDLLSVLQGASNSAASTVSAPVDGINWILKKAGFPVSDKPVGGSDWLKDKGLMAEPKNQNLGYVGEAIGGVLPMVAAAKAPQIASALNQMGANMAAPRTLNPQTGAIVWHGSPHKFDKFDSSKIGTGEGAQAYGHGIYTAEAKDVASSYRFAGDATKDLTYNGKPIKDEMRRSAAYLMHLNNYDKEAAKAVYQGKTGEKLAKIIDKLDAGKIGGGSLYKIDLPDEHIAKMLDWDKPLSQQQPDAALALEMLRDSARKSFPDIASGDPTGRGIYSAYQAHRGGNQAAASEKLRELGIPGIKYLDGGSRGTGAGTSNFVVFPGNENLLRILERNGIPLD